MFGYLSIMHSQEIIQTLIISLNDFLELIKYPNVYTNYDTKIDFIIYKVIKIVQNDNLNIGTNIQKLIQTLILISKQ